MRRTWRLGVKLSHKYLDAQPRVGLIAVYTPALRLGNGSDYNCRIIVSARGAILPTFDAR
jgi:hypothetical protein